MIDTKSVRALADDLLDTVGEYSLEVDDQVAAALRQCADEIDALHGQALSDPEREEYFAMKKKAAEYDTLRAENESATKYLRTFSEELVIAGYAGGDRDVTLANLRAIIKDAAVLRELVREAYEEADLGWLALDWEERAEKALAVTASPPL